MRLEGQLIKLKVRSKRFNAIHIVFGEKKSQAMKLNSSSKNCPRHQRLPNLVLENYWQQLASQ